MPEAQIDDQFRDQIREYMKMKTEVAFSSFCGLMLNDSNFVLIANSIGVDTSKELLMIIKDYIDRELSKGDSNE
jgi:hypothetical protein